MTRLVLIAALLILGPSLSGQSGTDLFQKGLAKERAEGQLEAAIQLYEQIVREFAADRPLAAKALLQIGRCYERLGKDGAQKAYDRLVRDYGDQRTVADEARARLAQLSRTSSPRAPSMRLVWAGSDVDTQGSPSPDGRYVSYVDYDGNKDGDLAIREIATGHSRRLTQGHTSAPGVEYASYSVFAPDGRQIAYAWNKGGVAELRVAGTDRGGPRTLYRNAEAPYLEPAAWTPDGKSIITVFETRDGAVQIAVVPVAGGTRRVLKTLQWKWPAGMSVSPDGKTLAYAVPVGDALKRDIFLLALDGSRERALVEHPSDDTFPFWTPDGTGVVFCSDRTGSLDVWFLAVRENAPPGLPVVIKRNLGRGRPIGLTRDAAMYFALAANSTDIHVGAFDPSSGRATAGPPISEHFVGTSYGPDWSPDGARLSYFSKRGAGGPGSSTIVVRSLADRTEREIVPRLLYFHRPRWMPDGKSFVAQGRGLQAAGGLFRIDAETGDVSTVLSSNDAEGASFPVWSPDRRTLFYSSKSGLIARTSETGAERVLDRCASSEKAVSPDGRWIALQCLDAPDGSATTLRLVPVDGGAARMLVSLHAPERVFYFGGLSWTPDGRRVLFVKQSGDARELWTADIASGASASTGLAATGLSYTRLHPDGRQLAYTAGKRQSELWVIEHFLPVRLPSPGLLRPGTGARTATRR
jgi:Tol biopolymer transport system component